MFKKIPALVAVIAALAAPLAQADEGPLLVRVRALHLDSANKDSTGLGLSINNKTFPEVDFSYFITPNIATELILTYPQAQTLYSNGAKIGSLKHLPPTLTLQYHFNPTGTVRPYVGAGINYTIVTRNRDAFIHDLDTRNAWGSVLQAGVEVPIDAHWSVSLDARKIFLKTKATGTLPAFGGAPARADVRLNPLVVFLSVGRRF